MKMHWFKYLLILIAIAGTTVYAAGQSVQPSENTQLNYIYKPGDAGYSCFRIPAMIATEKGSLLAFAEGRKNDCGDSGDIDLVLRRSEDGGKTWSPVQVVWSDSTNTCGNPVPIQDISTGKIWLVSTWNNGQDHEKQIRTQTGRDGRRIFILSSDDEGHSWSKPKEITQEVKLPDWTWYATGPCHGLQIANGKFKGRLVVPVNHVELPSNKNFVHIIYSDDHGATWKLGNNTPQDGTNEVTAAELAGGNIMLNIRNADRKKHTRLYTTSTDGGQTWANLQTDTTLIEPICQGSLLNLSPSKNKNILLFSNPADVKKRANLTLRASLDDGKSWPYKQVLFAGPSAYSDIAIYKKKQVACLYEAGNAKAYDGIAFQVVGLKGLLKN
ncbi:exo-alpha-sialidase [Mucilaginibacter ximonensis]|uniref:exo-alpha-sialidase n=1 Tax=Mucilaginibacter ximonensis TaxID=538021 RepID=A0ABW5YE66_9SPHI